MYVVLPVCAILMDFVVTDLFVLNFGVNFLIGADFLKLLSGILY